ncbi:DUF3105 domain-containing protein [Streptomyces globisporus]|uniref:DUF3105 domain-containing protein n=1 Tax=Streptomyces globisporus TaxID=1908 RepID=A0ABM9GSB9_STRGL|nr:MULTISPECIES: DUF3105 domain-containing protein [Streptomyces]RDL03361.1 uncharacterized protein DUF3105 [Streptomyces sp. HB202]WSU83957.1 DUF3105 domain-containing protein [Streptomyces globisporus]WSV92422.1 DUF3105 domain-containing protein [Streptomyces globisporus]CAH9414349.1 hypothetical protein SGL43_01352 [Streptomyces globisporus]GGW06526.1 membrane protein [Streptomyces globisporus]
MSFAPRSPQPQAPAPGARSTRNRAIAIGLSAAVVAGLVAFGSFMLLDNSAADEKSDNASAAHDGKHPGGHGDAKGGAIEGLKSWDAAKLGRQHVAGTVDYPMKPPVGGDHNASWMNCDGDVYEKALPDVNAVHSLEHGAVWVTYNGSAAEADVAALAERVEKTPFTLMSPYAGQEGAITLSAWGKQVTVDSADDRRVDQFLTEYVQGAQTPEPGAPCTGGLATVPQ